jgi:hypothetical protein
MNIVGLGKAGCAIADCFSKFSQYNTYKFDSNIEGPNSFNIPECSSHEEYEQNCPDFSNELQNVSGQLLFVVCGAGKVSGCSLRLVEQFSDVLVSILYVEPDRALLSEIEKVQETIVKNVLQEYTRSGVFDRIYLVSNSLIEKGIQNIPIMGYYDTLNQAIVNTLHMVNVFKNSEAILGTFTHPHEIARISTIGVVDLEENEEKWFFDLQVPRDVVYYYGIGEEDLRNDKTLLKKITDYTKDKVHEKINVSYGIYQTSYEQKYCYCIKHSSVVQSYIDELDDQDIS